MKKFGQLLLTALILTSGLLFSTSDAFAMGSKGDAKLKLSTNADVYSNNTPIVVSGWTSGGAVSIELIAKDGKVVGRKDVDYENMKNGNFTVSFPTKGLKGLYDVRLNGAWGKEDYHRVLTNYLKVNQ
ncbi:MULTISPECIES: hypothetical protein [Bacillus]|uniref:Group-specific protein n=1 Tax=Bacillus toyonensis TaxID=155322 RepID=A0AB36SDQ3_9BACI|nr:MULTISPECIES: hypothetical protein [Bacillus]MBY7113206.1 hypothetical protein [Bacillus sp. 17RED48]MCU5395937.1 hypothetical protein [Bacillus toyonensis]MCU5600456.1 hypothetical protein [Bacillus wiedmannii]PEB17020.1 hypothetical protein COO08_19675 [Bacillus toyonensis]PEE79254.1 hypothetical protein COO15_29900 [Bacillus toyonensis]